MTTIPPNAQALLAAAIAAESPALLALVGDCVEEQGGCGDGWRWMAEEGRWPMRCMSPDSAIWQWANADYWQTFKGHEEDADNISAEVFGGLEASHWHDCISEPYPTLAAALVACAAAYVAARKPVEAE